MSQLVTSLASLLRQTHITDDEEVLRAANAALKAAGSKGDLDTQHVKVVALLKLDRYDDALRALEVGGEALQSRAGLEHAYALYKAGQPAKAAILARKYTEGRAFRHVEAQAAYRDGDFALAAELYTRLEANLADDAEADLRVNHGAVDAQLEWSGRGDAVQKKKPSREDLDAFETAYNAACASIARGELAQGEILLRRSRDLCMALEDLTEEEKQSELLPIAVQQIYVLVRLGREAEAEALAKDLDTATLSGATSKHIAQVNKLAAAGTASNPFLAHRLADQDPESSQADAPFGFQSTIIRQNRYAAGLQMLKYEGTASSTRDSLAKTQLPSTDAFYTSVGVVNAAAHARNQTGKEALKHILPVLERRPNDVGLILTITQLYVLTGNSASATTLLEKFLARLEEDGSPALLNVRYAPGLIGTLVSLYRTHGRKAPLRTELAKAASYWRHKSKDDQPSGAIHLLKAAGSALLDSSEPEHLRLARDIFTDLNARDPSDRYSAAGLLAASPEQASAAQLASLTPVDRLVASVDAEALELAGVARPPSTLTSGAAGKKRPAAADEAKRPTKPKKIRATHMPKDFDPARKPDPERWLPLRDRSSYRPKGRKGKARQALMSQGAPTTAADSENSRPATPATEVVKAKQGGGGGSGGGQKKKKGKGGKW